jgi:hypothetical protein
MLRIEEKTLDDEVDELKDTVEQLRFDIKQEKEERRYETNEIRVDIGRVRLEKEGWNRSRETVAEMEVLEKEMNYLIGVRWWKPYIGGVFWSNLATPINISVSIFSLLSAGQSSISTFLTPTLATTLSFSVFMLSLINTFFTPHSRIVDSTLQMTDWKRFGNQFEKIYYSPRQTDQEMRERLSEYRRLMISMKEYLVETPDKQNLFVDVLYALVSLIKKTDQWMET